MNSYMTLTVALVLLGGSLAPASASSPAIGTATAGGQFLLDSAIVRDQATLLEGSLIQTGSVPSLLHLQGGAQVVLATGSTARTFAGRLVLEQGEARLERASALRIEAGGLYVRPSSPAASAQVSHQDAGTTTVNPLAGSWQVLTSEGLLVASLEPGMARAFTTQAASAAPPVVATGCLIASGGGFRITDETANVSFELTGKDLSRHSGNRVTVTGTLAPGVKSGETSTHILQVTRIQTLGRGCAVKPEVTAGAKGKSSAPGGAKTASTGSAAKTVIAGVAIAAAGGGAALGLTRGEDSKTISR
ncbi:MAG: hypothetical protein IT159_12065 [Bryobacterales bacterium]|nr:hypothetical protein [Bryobacterales bacterium]